MDLLEIKELRRRRRWYRPTIGVYFLFHHHSLVYIGQSVNLEARLAAHKRHVKGIPWSRYTVIECENQIQALRLEAAYIKKYNPAANVHKPNLPGTDHPTVDVLSPGLETPQVKVDVPRTALEKRRMQRIEWWAKHGVEV
jgi:predicted GIY-YIG superfamily endonuclease